MVIVFFEPRWFLRIRSRIRRGRSRNRSAFRAFTLHLLQIRCPLANTLGHTALVGTSRRQARQVMVAAMAAWLCRRTSPPRKYNRSNKTPNSNDHPLHHLRRIRAEAAYHTHPHHAAERGHTYTIFLI